MRARNLLQLRHVQPRQAADGVAQVAELLQQGQAPHVVFGVQALAAGRQQRLRHAIAALPHAQRGHRHPQHAGHGAAAVPWRGWRGGLKVCQSGSP
jgi:hypothetical protein